MTEREYVLVERDRWERVQEAARLWQQHWGQMWEGRRDVMREAGLEPGDLDLVEPEPSVAEMLDALIADDRPGYGREVEITENRMGGSVKVYRWFDDDDEGWKAVAGKHGIDWRDALRAVYQQKVNETCRQ